MLLLALPLVVQAQTLVYQDSFDDGIRSTNTNGLGGGLGHVGTSGDSWAENSGRLSYSGSGGGNRATIYTQEAFDLSHGFVLSVEYQHNFISGENRQFQFGLFQDWIGTNANPPLITPSVNKSGIGFNLLPGTGPYYEGLMLAESGATNSTFTELSPFVTGTGVHTLSLKVIPDGNGGANWSYAYDGGPEVSGNIPVFDFTAPFTFVGHARVGSGKFINEVTLMALPQLSRGTVIMISSVPFWVILCLALFLRRGALNRGDNN